MKKLLIILTATLFFTLIVDGQNLFFIGENSYPCTETITLQANSDNAEDLYVLVARDGEAALFAVSTESDFGENFNEKLIIYLEDGTVITCNKRTAFDFIDGKAKAVYSLSGDQLNSLRNSNIHTIRFTLETGPDRGLLSDMEWNWSASNIGTPTKNIISDFLDNKRRDTDDYRTANSSTYGEGTRGLSYNLAGRQPIKIPAPIYNSQSEGIVVVEVTVDRKGNVTQATPGVKGSTTLEEYFLEVAEEAALKSKFDAKPDAPLFQKGTITYHFILR